MTAPLNHALVFDDLGDRHGLTVREVPLPEPGPGRLRIRTLAFGLNQADLLLMQGRHYVVGELPIRLGYEGCGIVDAIGRGVTGFRVGERVTTLPNVDGPFWMASEYALADAAFTAPWPEDWSPAEATGFWMQYLTAYFPMAELFPVSAGDWVVITAASGGTGLGAIAVAKALGARVIATSRTSAKRQLLLDHGADIVIATEEEPIAQAVLKVTDGAGARLINDTIGGPFVAEYVEALAFGGTIYVHGGLSGSNEVRFPIVPLVRRRGALHGYSLINELRMADARERGRRFVTEGIATGTLPRPLIDSIFPMEQAADAYARMASGQQRGKIVVSTVAP